MELTREDILKSFYLWDKNHIYLKRIDNQPIRDIKDVRARIFLANKWTNDFQGLDVSIWERITAIVLQECNEYPDNDKILELINRIDEPEQQEPIKQPKPRRKLSEPEKLKKMFEAARQGDWSAARNIISDHEEDVTNDDIRRYSKMHWKDKPEHWIRNNQDALIELIKSERQCFNCNGYTRCSSNGCKTYGKVDDFGNLAVMNVICEKAGTVKKI